MNWNVEKSKKEDCKEIVEFITKTWNETYRGIVNEDFLSKLYETEDKRYNNAINNFDENNNLQYIVKNDNKIIAYLKLSKKEKCIELQSLYVLKTFQNNGIGKLLLNKAFEEAKIMGYDKIYIGCIDSNKSNGFYQKMGGKIVSKREFKLPNQVLYENVYEYGIETPEKM